MEPKLIKKLTQEFKELVPESFYRINSKDKVIYPYLTFAYTGEPIREMVDGFYLDIDIFDNKGTDDSKIENVLASIKKEMRDAIFMDDDMLIRFEYRNSNPIPTGSDTLQRRYLQLYCKVDWRK